MKRSAFSAGLLAAALLLSGCPRGAEPVTADPTETVTAAEPETTAPAPVDRTGEAVYRAHPALTPVDYDSPALLPRSKDAGQAYIDKLTFLCDSPTYWLKLYELLTDGYATTQVWTGPTGTMTLAYLLDFRMLDPVDNVERTIPETVKKHKPPFIVIALGVNGVAFMDREYFTAEYANLIEEIRSASPETEILLQSIYPVTAAYDSRGSITNEMITAANSWILRLAETYDLHYFDAFSCLLGEDGNADPALIQSDGLHPNKAGLTKVLKYLRTHAYTPDPAQ